MIKPGLFNGVFLTVILIVKVLLLTSRLKSINCLYVHTRPKTDDLKLGLPIADEALFTHNTKGFWELLSWVVIGACSAQDQEHRIFAYQAN